jgi:hypothetical protein
MIKDFDKIVFDSFYLLDKSILVKYSDIQGLLYEASATKFYMLLRNM